MSLELPSFDSVQESLKLFESLGEASQTHGLLCALFAGRVKLHRQAWINSLMTEMPDKSDPIMKDAQSVLTQLFSVTQEAFQHEEPFIDPLLPMEDAPLISRIEALAEFAKGFVMGLNLMGVVLKNNPNPVVQEAIDDLLNISCLAPQNEEGEEAEKAFFELVEYLKVAMVQMHWELKEEPGLKETSSH